MSSNRFVLAFVLCAGCPQEQTFDLSKQQQPPPPPATGDTTPTPPPGKIWPPPGEAVELAKELTARNFYVVFDGSGSMNDGSCEGEGTKIAEAKAALKDFSASLPNSANLGLFVFDRAGKTERVQLATDNRKEFNAAVDAVDAAATTPLKTAITTAMEKLTEQARHQLGYGEYNLVVITDGAASSNQDPTEVVAKILADTPILIHTIGFCIGKDHVLNQPGKIVYTAVGNHAELKQGLADVLAEAPDFTATSFKAK